MSLAGPKSAEPTFYGKALAEAAYLGHPDATPEGDWRKALLDGAHPEQIGELFFRWYLAEHMKEFCDQGPSDSTPASLLLPFETCSPESLFEGLRKKKLLPPDQDSQPTAVATQQATQLRLLAPLGDQPAAGLPFVWEAVEGASTYLFELFDDHGRSLWEQQTDRPWTLYPQFIPQPKPGRAYQWRVSTVALGKLHSAVAVVHPYDPAYQLGNGQPPPLHKAIRPRTTSGGNRASLRFWMALGLAVSVGLAAAIAFVASTLYRPTMQVEALRIHPDRLTPLPSPMLLDEPTGPIAHTRPTFKWEPIPGNPLLRLALYSSNLAVLFTLEVQGTQADFPANHPELEPGKAYLWEISYDQNGTRLSASRSFLITGR